MKIFFVILGVLITQTILAQKMYSEQYTTCPLKFILEDEEQYIFYEQGDSIMLVDFLKGIEDKQIEKLKGIVMLQVMIDTAFNVCCVSFTNKTTISDKKLDIPNRLVNMPGWKRMASQLPDENICALIHIYFEKYNYKVQHIGYNRNRGKQLIESYSYKRKNEASTTDSLPQ